MRGVVVAALGLLASVGVGCGEESASQTRPEGPDGYARVTRVIDGDSVVATRLGETRLIGVNAPEKRRCHSDEATEFTRERLLHQRVGYEFDKERKDRYGRTLAYLYRDGMHNLALVEEGYAKALTIYPNDKYASLFVEAERKAETQRQGMWSGECERRRRARRAARRELRAQRAEAAELERLRRLRRQERRERRELAAERRERRGAERSDRGSGYSGAIPENCSGVNGPIPTPPGDPTGLDADNDGQACE